MEDSVDARHGRPQSLLLGDIALDEEYLGPQQRAVSVGGRRLRGITDDGHDLMACVRQLAHDLGADEARRPRNEIAHRCT